MGQELFVRRGFAPWISVGQYASLRTSPMTSTRTTGGSARKIGIIVDGMRHLVKFQGRETTRNADSVISEYLSSHIACAFGIPAHETTIVSIDGELAVACKNFEGPGERHIDFDRLMRRHYASKDVGNRLTIAQIREVLNTDRQLAPAIEENRRSFSCHER